MSPVGASTSHAARLGAAVSQARGAGEPSRKEEPEEGNRWEKGNHINMQRECSRFTAAK